ncbi:uncharacterized protein LOC106639675 [Copidosoma floridanum]|uniref:uncharacterized protein LOC106639675 n=1 Tax=Copidosoma floridanum TaxID=29053 RepID=UPI0006C9A84F|nr:uncharacterized protein LOC106639675 [Copidosoma floridanum]
MPKSRCWLLLFLFLLLGITAGDESTKKKEVYYKQSVLTAAASPQPVPKEDVKITMEGQTPILNSKILKKKTVPRKGVLPEESIESQNKNGTNGTVIDSPSIDPVKKTNSSVLTELSTHIVVKSTATVTNETTKKPINLHVAPVKEDPQEKEPVVASHSSTTRTPKPKPILTIGGKEADGPIPASPTDKSPISMPRKIDYIVPIIITFTALPLLGVTFYVLYKRGKDYWSKRHYRRMDFLIDGMYNE